MQKPKGLDNYTDPVNDFDYEKYLAYINSETWAKLRAERLLIDDYQCSICGSPYNLQVHHLIYPRILGTESINDLITLCDKCHRVIEDNKKNASYHNHKWKVSFELNIVVPNYEMAKTIYSELITIPKGKGKTHDVCLIWDEEGITKVNPLGKISFKSFQLLRNKFENNDCKFEIYYRR